MKCCAHYEINIMPGRRINAFAYSNRGEYLFFYRKKGFYIEACNIQLTGVLFILVQCFGTLVLLSHKNLSNYQIFMVLC